MNHPSSEESVAALERRREQLFWWTGLALALASPLVVFHAVKTDDGLQWRMPNFFQIFFGFFPGMLFAILLEALFSVAQGRPLNFWRKNPSVQFEHYSNRPPPACVGEILLRLGSLGFVSSATPDARRVDFHKKKAPSCTDFADHAFSGYAELDADGAGTRIRMTVVFQDTIIIETGEMTKLRNLAAAFCGLDIPPAAKTVSLLMLSAAADGFLAVLLLLVPYFRQEGITWLQALGVGAVASAGVALVEIYRKPSRLFGIRLGVVAIVLGLAPFVAILVRKFL